MNNLPLGFITLNDQLIEELTPQLHLTLNTFGYKENVYNECKISRVKNIKSYFIYLAVRWNAQYQFYTSSESINASYTESGKEKLRVNDLGNDFGMATRIKTVKLYDVDFEKNVSHQLYTGEKTGTHKAFYNVLSDEMPIFLKNYVIDKTFNISKSDTFDELCEQYDTYAKDFMNKYSEEKLEDSVNENIDNCNHEIEQIILKKIKPDIEHEGLEYSYEQIDRSKNKLKFLSLKLIEFEYGDEKHFIILDDLNSYAYFNKSLKVKGSGFLSRFF